MVGMTAGTRHFTWRNKVMFFALFLLASSAFANPVLTGVTAGDAQVTQSGNTTTIQQNSQRAILEWNSFNIGANEHTHFQQPNGGAALNRIDPHQGVSQIFGQLSATGQIILVNQAGIYFGPTARVDVGSIIASTSDISNANFLAGKYVFDQPSQYRGSIINEGTIRAANYGLVALIGTGVDNRGLIEAKMGNVVLASGSKFTIDMAGDGLVNFTVDEEATQSGLDQNGQPLKHGVNNLGRIIANGGHVIIAAKVAQGVLDNVINMQGVVEAHSVSQRQGTIILDAHEGNIQVAGKLDVGSHHAGVQGGMIKVLGKNILIKSSAFLNASGDAGGGTILIGGNYQGLGPEINALTTTVEKGAVIKADALTYGNGGKVIIWSNDFTQAYGNISAHGGLQGGDGGLIETSGHFLSVQDIKVDTSAPYGKTGLWLLDPADVTIKNNGGVDSQMTLSNGVYAPNNNFETTTIDVSNLVAALNSSNIQVITTNTGGNPNNGAITVANAVLWGSSNTLTLTAVTNININADISSSGGGGLVLSAPRTVSIASTLGANGALGSLTVTGATTITGSSIRTSGNQTYNSAVTVGAATTLTAGSNATISFANGISGSSALSLTGANQYSFAGNIASAANISVTGGGSSNTLTINSGNSSQNWAINGANSGLLSGVGSSFTFSNIQNLSSTASISNFTFNSGGSLSSISATGTKVLNFTMPVVVQMTSSTAGSVVGVLPSFSNVASLNGTGMTLQLLGSSIYDILFTGGGAGIINSVTSFTGLSTLIGNGSTIGRFAAGLVVNSFTSNSFVLNGVQISYTNVVFPGFSGSISGFVLLADGTVVNVPSVLSQMTTAPTSTTASNTPSSLTDVAITQATLVQQTISQMAQQVQTEMTQNFQQSTLAACS
ncbi:hypothetical protein AYO45_05570 [Gammaproteobacteria bacterium SCGC AG-212-F23]|nr:hypothetical protein AYO45_05570 [Gammaproteobacteria bacterium SCGC AG-212-F23]